MGTIINFILNLLKKQNNSIITVIFMILASVGIYFAFSKNKTIEELQNELSNIEVQIKYVPVNHMITDTITNIIHRVSNKYDTILVNDTVYIINTIETPFEVDGYIEGKYKPKLCFEDSSNDRVRVYGEADYPYYNLKLTYYNKYIKFPKTYWWRIGLNYDINYKNTFMNLSFTPGKLGINAFVGKDIYGIGINIGI